jgi:hypothetical protein
MDNFVKWVTMAATIIEARRQAGFPVAREIVDFVTHIINPPTSYTDDMWAAQAAKKAEALAAYAKAKPGDIAVP